MLMSSLRMPPTWAEIRYRSMPHTTFTGFSDGSLGRHCHLSVHGLGWMAREGRLSRTQSAVHRPTQRASVTTPAWLARLAGLGRRDLAPAAQNPVTLLGRPGFGDTQFTRQN